MNLKIFFDESGKNMNPPMIMGAISIPEKVYFLDNIQEINKDLQDKKRKYHFTDYCGDYGMKNRIIALFKAIAPYLHTCRANTLQYNKDSQQVQLFNDMIYSKFPERVFYGLLRCKGQLMNINADIFMEDATEYKDFPKRFKSQLNSQSLYRGEGFKINNCSQVPKHSEIGVELIDIILGIMRVILEFDTITKKTTKSSLKKVELVNELLTIPEVYKFFESIKYFEWNSTQSLKEINFKNYLDAYITETI